MRKKSTRLLSAALAACMMLSALPVGAFAAEPGTEPENTVTAQEETEGFHLEEGATINEDFIKKHGNTYTIGGKKDYQYRIIIDTNEDVTINFVGDTVGCFSGANIPELKKAMIEVKKVNKLTINNQKNYKYSAKGYEYIMFLWVKPGAAQEVEVNGGIYKSTFDTFLLESGKVTLNDVQTVDDFERSIYNSGATVTVNNGRYSATNAEYRSDDLIYNNGGTLYLNNVEVDAQLTAVCNYSGEVVINGGTYTSRGANTAVSNVGTMKIMDGEFETKEAAAVLSGNNLEIHGGTFTGGKENGSGIYIRGDAPATIENATIKGNKYGIRFEDPQVTLKSAEFEDNEIDLCQNEVYKHDQFICPQIQIEDSFDLNKTLTVATVSDYHRDPTGRQFTTATDSHYQKDLKLVSADPKYIIDYKNDDGMEYRYFNTRETSTSFYVNAINATASTGDGIVLKPYAQLTEGTPVKLTADIPEGKKFTGWKVEKIAADGVTEVKGVLVPDSENPETATLTMPDCDVFVTAEYEDEIVDPGTGDDAADNIKGALSAIVVGAVAGAIIYETGTGIFRVINMPGIAMPSNRGELAMLLWEHAGKPEPVSTALYSDITEDDIDLNKAAHWAVEQGLMQDDSEKNTFNPRFPVSKLRTCLTWNAAKEKGLFDTDKPAE